MKELYPESMKNLVREVMEELFKEKKEEYEELKYVIKPTQLKATIREIIKYEGEIVMGELITKKANQIWYQLFDKITPIIKEEIIMNMKNVDIPEVLVKNFNKKLSENFKSILIEALKITDKEVSVRIQNRLKPIINLKTSTICAVQGEMRKIFTKTDEDYLKQLEIEDKTFSGDKRYLEWFEKIGGDV